MFPIFIPIETLWPQLSPLWGISPFIYLSGVLLLWLTRYTHHLVPRMKAWYYILCILLRPLGIFLITLGWMAVLSPPALPYMRAPLSLTNPGLKVVGYLGMLFAFAFFLWSVLHLGLRRSFFYRHFDDPLITDGPYRLVRHPQFLASILMVFFASIVYLSIFALVNVLIFAFALWCLAIVEERELEAHFGEAYREYARRVPRLWPN